MKTVCVMQEGPANALATNKDATQVVIAGRNVFKIFNVEDDDIVEKLNLRVGKNINLNYSCADVVWNPVEDNILATAATNGAVVTWNLNKASRSKQDMVFQQHKRTVNKVSFHPVESHILISGSQDGTMKHFDLRKKEATCTFYSNSESVRDVQFSPHQHFMFAAIQENGNVQLWDLRKTDRYERQFTGHNGPVFACDWHPEERRWLATAGRDKTIKVWDLGGKPMAEYTIQTIASVARIKWRPQRKWHIASSSLVVDFSVNIWDIRRPYIPFAAFNEHKDVTTGVAWRNSPQVFLSTSKDSTLIQHAFADAARPANHANPMGLDINGFGDIMLASSEKILNENSAMVEKHNTHLGNKLPAFFRRGSSLGDQFASATSSCFCLQNRFEKNLSMNWLVESAKRYLLTGRPFGEMCDHNAAVATDLDRHLVAQTWNMLKLLYGNTITVPATDPSSRTLVGPDGHRMDIEMLDPTLTLTQEVQNGDQISVRHLSGGGNPRHHSGGGSGGNNPGERQPGDTSTGFSGEDDTETDETDHERTLTNIALGMTNHDMHGDFLFGDGEFDQLPTFDFDPLTAVDAPEDWMLPNEAFQPRHEIFTHSPPPEQLCISTFSSGTLPNNTEHSDISHHHHHHHHHHHPHPTAPGLSHEHTSLVTKTDGLEIPEWEFTSIVVDMLHHYANQGDVQMSVSVLLVLGNRFKGIIEEQTQEQWYTSYIDLLTRFQLWTVANEVTKLSPLPSVSSLNQQSTTVHTNCNNCLRQMQRVGWLCDRCKKLTNTCSVCHNVVKGLYVWCQGCSHGGHLQHMEEWLSTHRQCPTGCGHACVYT